MRLVLDSQGAHESQWAAIGSVSSKIGCSAETLRKWVRQAERDEGVRPGLTSAERERLKALERENRELRRANEILRKASAYFAPPLGDCTALPCWAAGRSSTADPSRDVVHQFAPRAIRGRADLRRAADRPIDVLRRQGPGDGPSPVSGAGAPRRGTARAVGEVGEALDAVRSVPGISESSRLCLEFLVLTDARSGEALGAAWAETVGAS